MTLLDSLQPFFIPFFMKILCKQIFSNRRCESVTREWMNGNVLCRYVTTALSNTKDFSTSFKKNFNALRSHSQFNSQPHDISLQCNQHFVAHLTLLHVLHLKLLYLFLCSTEQWTWSILHDCYIELLLPVDFSTWSINK